MIDIDYILSKHPGARVYEDGFEVTEGKHDGAVGIITPVVQKKRWGGEAWLVYTDRYALKILYVNQGNRLSLQRHKQKEETWEVLKGEPEILLADKTLKCKPGDLIHVPPNTVHRISAPTTDVEILEVSSPELWDLERIEDDYNRGQYEGKNG